VVAVIAAALSDTPNANIFPPEHAVDGMSNGGIHRREEAL